MNRPLQNIILLATGLFLYLKIIYTLICISIGIKLIGMGIIGMSTILIGISMELSELIIGIGIIIGIQN